ncbi:MAG: GntR family transcriptional regulator [Bryobacteraceae bacterium]
MFVTIDVGDKRPIYQQVVDGIKALIAGGALREGMTLPSVRQVAGDLGVNLNTIAGAYRQLQQEGLLSVRHGAGAVVAAQRSQTTDRNELLKPLRTALTELVLAGWSDREIAAAARDELRALRRKGDSR